MTDVKFAYSGVISNAQHKASFTVTHGNEVKDEHFDNTSSDISSSSSLNSDHNNDEGNITTHFNYTLYPLNKLFNIYHTREYIYKYIHTYTRIRIHTCIHIHIFVYSHVSMLTHTQIHLTLYYTHF